MFIIVRVLSAWIIRFMFSVLLLSGYFFNTLSRPVTAYLPCFSLLSSKCMVEEVFLSSVHMGLWHVYSVAISLEIY